jgi:hypothetical protein
LEVDGGGDGAGDQRRGVDACLRNGKKEKWKKGEMEKGRKRWGLREV